MRAKQKESLRGVVQFEKHPPERRRTLGGYLLCGGGCCCCCCCVHALGGLLGAAAATAQKEPSGASVSGFYWKTLGIIAAVVIIALITFCAGKELVFNALIASVFLPGAQLLASFLTLTWILAKSAYFPDRKAALRTLVIITLWSIIGSVLGLVLMVVGAKLFSSWKMF